MNVLLISTYELGHQPFGLASPAAWLSEAGAEVTCQDLAITSLDETAVKAADLVAFYVPMHTATRMAATLAPRVKRLNARAHLCFFGLYAPVNESYLRRLGVETILGGEFETGLVSLYRRLANGSNGTVSQPEATISLSKQTFRVPLRTGLPPLSRYAFLDLGDGQRRVAGYTEASRGCKHRCRHCPIVPVYEGRFRIVQQDIVLADIRRQVAAGAQHITFGDPDFFNGPGHAIPLVRALHQEFPDLTYDVIIKIEHLLNHADYLSVLKETNCLFVTSAVEAVDDAILTYLDKGHTRADFVRAVSMFREVGLLMQPTFVAFNPWISLAGYLDLLRLIAALDLVTHVPPIQYAIRLLIPAGSRLLELAAVREMVGPFDEAALVYPWTHPQPQVDRLQAQVLALVQDGEEKGLSRPALFEAVWQAAAEAYAAETGSPPPGLPPYNLAAEPTPFLSEPWYC